jgi:putative redox protein
MSAKAKVTLRDGLRCEVTVRDHEFVSDEPEDKGGGNEGPTPTELLLSALGGCTAMTLRMYAEHKGLKLEEVEVELQHDWVTRDDWEEWPEGEDRKRLPRILRSIRVKGDLTEEQRERLAYIANRCPVHRTITERPVVVDDLTVL